MLFDNTLLEGTGNGSTVPIYTRYKFKTPSRYKIKEDYNPYTSDPNLPTHSWTLLDGNNNYVTDYQKFPFQRGTSAGAGEGSIISNVSENRYWVSSRSVGKAFLLNEKGATLALFSTVISSLEVPNAFDNGILVINDHTVIDRNGHVLFQNDKFKIAYIIDDYVLIANDVSIPASTRPGENYVYINYRSGKVIYRGGDHEKKG